MPRQWKLPKKPKRNAVKSIGGGMVRGKQYHTWDGSLRIIAVGLKRVGG